MKRFALGCLLMSPNRFGKMLVGDFLAAMAGYNEAEHERFKTRAELIRIQTTILWNVQVDKNCKLKPSELWPFPWDSDSGIKLSPMSDEKRKEIEDLHEEILLKQFSSDGNSDIKS